MLIFVRNETREASDEDLMEGSIEHGRAFLTSMNTDQSVYPGQHLPASCLEIWNTINRILPASQCAPANRAHHANAIDFLAVCDDLSSLQPSTTTRPSTHRHSLISFACLASVLLGLYTLALLSLIRCEPTAAARLDTLLVLLACAFVLWALLNSISRRYG